MTKACRLYYEEYGEGNTPTLLILHGFFASSRNWRQVAKSLAEHYHVYVLDMRNHGHSPHNAVMDYPSMSADIEFFLETHQLSNAHILGHSMGGKVAMWLALTVPEAINQLMVVDISPVSYQHSFDDIIGALKNLPLDRINNRKQADNLLEAAIPELSFRQFLLQNLVLKAGQYAWRIDLDIFFKNADNIIAFPETQAMEPYRKKALFLAGGQSKYVQAESVYALFPYATISIIEGAGHWLHAENPNKFCQQVLAFLSANIERGAG